MRYFKLDLLTLLVSLFILNSCQNPDSIGLDIAPKDQIIGELMESTVEATTVKEDAFVANKLSQQPLGNMQDPVFGTTEAGVALSLAFPVDSTVVTFGTSPVLDSAVLVLRYGSEFYGDAQSSTYTVNVHQLNESYNNSATYYQDKEWDYNTTVVAAKNLNKFNITDSVRIIDVIKGKNDVAKKVAPQLRIPVDAAFINTNFLNANADNFSTNTKFANHIKGLYLKVSKTGSGGMVFFTPDSSKLELYYKRQNGTTVDTNVVRFRVISSASNVKHNYAGTPVETQLNNPTQITQSVFVQPLGGVRTRVRFPDIQKSLGNIIVNKAELVVYVDQQAPTPFAPAPRLTLYRTDIAGQRQEVPDNDIGQLNGFGNPNALDITSFGGFYDTNKKRYVFNISSYIQNILSGRMQQYDTYIAAINKNLQRNPATSGIPNPQTTDLFPSGTTAAHTVLGSAVSPEYKMKLNITYTRLGQ